MITNNQEPITLGTLTTNTNTTAYPLGGGRYVAHVAITSGTGTAKFQISGDNGTTFADIKDAAGAITLTASGSFTFVAGNKDQVRGNLSGSASTPSFTFIVSYVGPA